MLRRIPLLLALFSAVGLSACNVSTPFLESGKPTAAGDTVFVGLTHAVLEDDRQSRSLFFDYVQEVEDSLSANPGYLGFSKRVALFGDDAWTMSIWSDEASMDAFVQGDTHQRAIRKAFRAVESARFARLEINAKDAPPTWEEALQILESDGRSY